jgi:hypothetical protein
MQGLEISTHAVAQVILMDRDLGRDEAELRAFIDGMSEEEQASLVALMWVGRGSFEPEELDEAYRTALTEATTATSDYLIGTPHLSEHLESALDGYGIDVTEIEDEVT